MNQVFEQEFWLSPGETDAEARLSLTSLVSRIIDISTAHANSLGVGNPAMEHLGRGWVLTRLTLEMTDYPRANTTYRLSTWVEVWNKHFSERCYMVADAAGNPLGYGRSIWMVLDTETHRSTGLEHLSLIPDVILPGKTPIAPQGKHTMILESAPEGKMPRGTVIANAPTRQHTFGYSDLDFYRHVNTVRYIALLLNQYTLAQLDEKAIGRIEMTFAREALYAEPLDILRHNDEDTSYFQLNNAADGEPIFFARITLR